MTLYVSWDVGIVNMAYCIIKKETDTTFAIQKWGIVNLTEPVKICCMTNKNKKKCTSKAMSGKDGMFYCKKHNKDYIKPVCALTLLKTNNKCMCGKCTKESVVQENNFYYCAQHANDNNIAIPKCITCAKRAACVVDGKYYCTAHGKAEQKKIDKNNNLTVIKKKNANKTPLHQVSMKLIEDLNKIPELLQVDHVLIENQPVIKNPTMKSVMMMLHTYFVFKGLSVDKKPGSTIKDISMICPANKLKTSTVANKKIEDMKNDKDKNERDVYIMTKSLGKKLCKELIKNDAENMKLLNESKKQDDLCDAFLQGYYHIFCKGGVPKETEELLDELFKT